MKYYGRIGFAETVETKPGVWEEIITEKPYYGDITRNMRRLDNNQKVNDNVNIDNVISIVADPFACQNFHKMRYVEFMGSKWRVGSVEVQYPRLLLTVGGLYNVTAEV